jgi:hypothetical protein
LPDEEKFDIWMGFSQAMARENTWEFVIIIGNLLVNILMNHASKQKFNL